MSKQDIAFQALKGDRPSVSILYGAAGPGKTYTAIAAATEWAGGKEAFNSQKKKRNGKKIVIIRPNESFAKDIGFLPGTAAEKMAPWMQPIIDNLIELGVDKQFDVVISDMAPNTTGIKSVDQIRSLQLVEMCFYHLKQFSHLNLLLCYRLKTG